MFLSMLAGDVASAHGHEFSRPPVTAPAGATTTQGQHLARRLALPRGVLPSTRQRPPHGPSPLGRRATTPSGAASLKLTMAELKEEPEEEVEEQESRHSEDSLSVFRMPGAFHGSANTKEPIGHSFTLSIPRTLSEPLVQTITSRPDLAVASPAALHPMSIDTPTSVTFDQPSSPAVVRRARGPKTALRFAHPTPPMRPLGKHGLLRPKILLQLQQRQESGFHKPLYDVLPANRFAPRTKIGQKIHRLHKCKKDGLEADDLVVINAEDYSVSDTVAEEIENVDPRALMGVISPTFSATVATTVAEFSLENTVWSIRAGKNGASYTLQSQCDFPQTARWYIPKRKRNSVTIGSSAAPTAQEDRKFYFTTILPDCKQHPIIASMTEVCLEVNDSYTISSREEEIITDEATRKLIIMSAAWVFFMEGWSNNYKVKPKSNSCSKPPYARANSLPVEPTRRRSIFTQSPSQSPRLQASPNGGPTRSSSSTSSEAPSLVPKQLPDTLCLSDAGIEREQDESRISDAEVNADRQGPEASQNTTSKSSNQENEFDSQRVVSRKSWAEASPSPPIPEPKCAMDVPRIEDVSQKDEKQRNRRSWSHRELKPRVGSLVRTLSHRHKRDGPVTLTADSAHDSCIASLEDRPLSSHAGVRHFRRISQHLRHLNLGKPDAAHVTTEAIRPFTPPQPLSAPQSRPATAKSTVGSETITIDDTSSDDMLPKADLDFAARNSKESLQPKAQSPVTVDRAKTASQSTDTIPDPTQFNWWRQYDQFIERHCSPVAERYSLEQSQHWVQETLQDPECSQQPLRVHSRGSPQEVSYEYPHVPPQERFPINEASHGEVPHQQVSNCTYTGSPICTVEMTAAGSGRLNVWKEKLRSKLHV